jgi:hypothetical protein
MRQILVSHPVAGYVEYPVSVPDIPISVPDTGTVFVTVINVFAYCNTPAEVSHSKNVG